ncbi:hypothetical protein DUI87_29081 [Hirundo rustica rustica]|uniref:Uncharacterized protein n=1 Tax=Hirundo rustica rustica TaxID=333673 RepID=A0A3M0IZS4_HIRRU|nr:hypothetical protein DUI87_29081 [Hirundo rustica rustica]
MASLDINKSTAMWLNLLSQRSGFEKLDQGLLLEDVVSPLCDLCSHGCISLTAYNDSRINSDQGQSNQSPIFFMADSIEHLDTEHPEVGNMQILCPS